MRHLIASILIQNETSIEDISVMLGHQSTKYTESVYASKDQKQALRATNKFKDMMTYPKEDKRLEKLRILMPDKTDEQLKIFEKFYRTDKSRNKNSGGTGLGMSIMKKIIDIHNGKINIKSIENKGTIVEILFQKNNIF